MTVDVRIRQFLDEIEVSEGTAPLSEAKMTSLGDDRKVVTVLEGEAVIAVGATARHEHSDGSTHTAVETAVPRSMAFPEFERQVLDAALQIAGEGPVSVWSRRSTLDAALADAGFAPTRSLAHMVVDLPIADLADGDRSLRESEIDDLMRVNNAAFRDHREAGTLDRGELERLAKEPWFGLEGIRVVAGDGVRAFCWTKVHPNGDGEVYRIAVDPDFQGSGLGRQALIAGYGYLANRDDVRRGTLWVDEANTRAMGLYEAFGMRIESRNREFERVD